MQPFLGFLDHPSTRADMLNLIFDRAVARIKFEADETCRRLVQSWPAAFDNSYPLSLGFQIDQDGFAGCIREYQELYLKK